MAIAKASALDGRVGREPRWRAEGLLLMLLAVQTVLAATPAGAAAATLLLRQQADARDRDPTGTSDPGAHTAKDPAEDRAALRVESPTLLGHVRFLSDDLLEGRAPGTKGDLLARRYVAAQLEGLGLEPAGPGGSWEQPFDVVGVRTAPPEVATFAGSGGEVALKVPEDLVVFAGRQAERSAVEDAELVFAGYGIVAPEEGWDDFKDVDVRGKVLLVMNNDPAADPDLFGGETRLYYGRWDYKYDQAARKGAAGVVIIHTAASAGYPWQVVTSSFGSERFELPQGGEARLELRLWATEEASRRIAALGGRDLDELRRAAESRDFRPVPLGVTLSLATENQLRRLRTANVLGVLPGSDPELSREWVLYTAHLDHLGIGAADARGDSIYNGAMDNAAGVAGMLAIAEAFAEAPERPRRSVLFAAVAAEESGLLGSQRLAAQPPVPAGRLAANVNLDGANLWGRTRDVQLIGKGKSNLDGVVEAVAAGQGRVVVGDQFPDRGHFYRSDQFSFARIGVPAVYLHTGLDFVGRPEGWGREQVERWVETNYHQPSDELEDDWNLEGAVEDLRLLFRVGWRVANADALPAWTPGDEFEAARKRALETP